MHKPLHPLFLIYLLLTSHLPTHSQTVDIARIAQSQQGPNPHQPQSDPDTARIARTMTDSITLAPLIYLASDELKGRFIGGDRIEITENYIAAQFQKSGARPAPGATGYFQVFKRTFGRHDLRQVGIDQVYNMPGVEPSKNIVLKNIIAYIPGTDPILRHQYILLSAHYDHIGLANYPLEVDGNLDSIYNGARDNATGTAAVIAAAHYFGKYPPERSVLLICFTAEEEGEFGSEYYAQNPLIPLNRTIFNLNVDNAGYNTTDAICLFGRGRTTVDFLIEEACSKYGLAVLADPPHLELFERSDNVNLAKTGVPAPCFSLGMTKWDDKIDLTYHRRDDNIDNMDLGYIVKFIHAYILSAQYIANDPVQPRWTPGDEYEKAWINLYTPSHLGASPRRAALPPLKQP